MGKKTGTIKESWNRYKAMFPANYEERNPAIVASMEVGYYSGVAMVLPEVISKLETMSMEDWAKNAVGLIEEATMFLNNHTYDVKK